MAAKSRRHLETWTVSRRFSNLVIFYAIIFLVIWAWFTIRGESSYDNKQPVQGQQPHSALGQGSFSQGRRPLSQQVHEYTTNTSPQSIRPFELSTKTCPTILWQPPKDHIPFPLVPPSKSWATVISPGEDPLQTGGEEAHGLRNSVDYRDAAPEEEWSTWTHVCKSIKSWSPLFSIHHCTSLSHCAQGYFSIKRLSNCPADATGAKTSDYTKLSQSPKHARFFLQDVGPDGFHAVFHGEQEQYAVRQKQYVGNCEVILHYHMAMPGHGNWTIVHEYSNWNHVNETSQMGWPPLLGNTILTWPSHICPECTYEMMHRYTPRESLPTCSMGDVRYPLLGAFIRKHSDSVKEENESFEWVPHGCRLVHPDGVSGESRLVGFSIDGSASLVSNTEGPVNPKMEPPSFGLGEEVKASDKEDGAIEERSILLIGDSHVRALAEDLTRSFAGGVDPSVQEHKNEASSSGVGRKFAMHIGKTVVLDVQRKSGNGRVRVHIQYQFDPFLYHLGNISASAQAKMTLSAQEVYANSQRQRSVYTAGVAGPEVPSFLPPFQEHVFDAVIFNFGHWPASSKLLGGHWTTDQVLAHLKLVVNSLKDYGNLRMREYEHIRHEEQQRHNYFSRMYGGGRSSHLHSSPSSRSNKPYRALQTLFLGMPAVRPRADTFVKEAGDWKNNYRLAYWSSLAEELMTSNGIPTFDSFGVTLPAASDAIDGAYSLNQEVADAIVAAVIHFLDV